MGSSSIESFSLWLKGQGKAEGTISTYLEVISKFNRWIDSEGYPNDEMKEEYIQSYITNLEKDKSPSTVEKYFSALSMYSKFLGYSQIMLNIIRKTREQKFEMPKYLELTEQKLLLKSAESDGNTRNIAIIVLLLHTGIRVSELCNLNISDIEIKEDHSKIMIRNNRGEIDRIIPLSQLAQKHLKSYMESNTQNLTDALFVSNTNNRITTRTVQYILKKYDVNPHKLRHTFCYSLINRGIDIGTVSKLAGHKDINVTKRYLKDADINLLDAIDKTFSN